VPPLLLAADSGCAEIVAELVSARATIDIQDSAGRTALICASALGHQDVVAMLLEAGADPLATTKEGCSPLLHAVEYFGSECLSRPISKKSLSDKAGAIAVARLLLEARADVHASTEDGRTPHSLAATMDERILLEMMTGVEEDRPSTPSTDAGA